MNNSKKLIAATVMFIVGNTAFATTGASDEIVVSSRKFEINLIDTNLKYSDISAKLVVNCSYKSRPVIGWPETKSCGRQESILAVDSSGNIQIPEVKKFNEIGSDNLENYSVDLDLESKTEVGDDAYIGSVHGHSEKGISDFNQLNSDLNLVTLNGTMLPDIKIQGQQFVGSSHTKENRATFIFRIANKATALSNTAVVFNSKLVGFRLGVSNRFSTANPGSNKTELMDLKTIQIPKAHFIFQGRLDDVKLEGSAWFMNEQNHQYSSKANIKPAKNGLELIDGRDLDMKRIK